MPTVCLGTPSLLSSPSIAKHCLQTPMVCHKTCSNDLPMIHNHIFCTIQSFSSRFSSCHQDHQGPQVRLSFQDDRVGNESEFDMSCFVLAHHKPTAVEPKNRQRTLTKLIKAVYIYIYKYSTCLASQGPLPQKGNNETTHDRSFQ